MRLIYPLGGLTFLFFGAMVCSKPSNEFSGKIEREDREDKVEEVRMAMLIILQEVKFAPFAFSHCLKFTFLIRLLGRVYYPDGDVFGNHHDVPRT